MGLSIIVHCNLVFVAKETKRSQYKTYEAYKKAYSKYADQDLIHLYNIKDFKERADGIKSGWYSGDSVYSFPAGSYSGYGNWRRMLAEMLGVVPEDIWAQKDLQGPFVELINYADNEGFIGPETSAKLAGDFKSFDSLAKKFSKITSGPWSGDEWYQLYTEFGNAFELASQCDGVVRFH